MTEPDARTPKVFSLSILPLIIVLSALGAIVGLQLITTLGVTTNTGLIGALVAMGAGRIPLALFRTYRSKQVQNLAQSAVSAACFGAANAMLLPIGIPYLLDRQDLIMPLFAGVSCATFLDAFMLYRLFGSTAFPESGAWPSGVAIAETIRLGDSGGRKVAVMAGGMALGLAGYAAGIPMAAFGTALIGNAWALSMFSAGLLAAGYGLVARIGHAIAASFPDMAPDPHFLPHGMMAGASIVALIQVVHTLLRRDARADPSGRRKPGRTLVMGLSAFLVLVVGLSAVSGVASGMSPGLLIAFVLYTAFSAFVHEVVVGLAAMHSGWFPAFAIALITLLLGGLIGFPLPALAILVGFTSATGPAFADMGYDLKAGFLLRGRGADPALEREGRYQQFLAACVAFVTAGAVVLLTWRGYFSHDLFSPATRVFAATIHGSVHASVARSLLFWALPGIVLQALGGQRRQLGVLLATGLLIGKTHAGWAVLAGLVVRAVWTRLNRSGDHSAMRIFAGGAIAADALSSFLTSFTGAFHQARK